MHIQRVFGILNLPSVLEKCSSGMIESPLATFSASACWYGFPPALIPIWSDGSGPNYIGMWKHWFVEREPTFVKMYVGSGRLTIEIARTPEQLCSLIIMMSISEQDKVSQKAIEFSKQTGIVDLQEINQVSMDSGDDPHGFIMLDQFKFKTPLESVANIAEYSGEFPVGKFGMHHSWWLRSTSFEIPEHILKSWPADIPMPPWLDITRQNNVVLFNKYLSAGNLAYAWLTLNSTGWTICDARLAIEALREKANDSRFDLLVRTWLAVADESAGGY